MDFFGVGPVEVLVVLLVALIIFGPDELPGIAVKVARFVRQIRELTNDITGEFTKEIGSVIQLEEPAKLDDSAVSRSAVANLSHAVSSPEMGRDDGHLVVPGEEMVSPQQGVEQSDPQGPVSALGTEEPETNNEPGKEASVGENTEEGRAVL